MSEENSNNFDQIADNNPYLLSLVVEEIHALNVDQEAKIALLQNATLFTAAAASAYVDSIDELVLVSNISEYSKIIGPSINFVSSTGSALGEMAIRGDWEPELLVKAILEEWGQVRS